MLILSKFVFLGYLLDDKDTRLQFDYLGFQAADNLIYTHLNCYYGILKVP